VRTKITGSDGIAFCSAVIKLQFYVFRPRRHLSVFVYGTRWSRIYLPPSPSCDSCRGMPWHL